MHSALFLLGLGFGKREVSNNLTEFILEYETY